MTRIRDIGCHSVSAFAHCLQSRSQLQASCHVPFPINIAAWLRAPQRRPRGQPIADTPWASVYQDEVLQALIKEALANNYDMRIAATRVLQANANLGITRADQFPIAQRFGLGIINERNQLTNLTSESRRPSTPSHCPSTTLSTSGDSTAAPPSQPVRACSPHNTPRGRADYVDSILWRADYFLLRQYDDQLEYSKEYRRGRHRDPEAQPDQVQGRRKRDHGRLSGRDTVAAGRSPGDQHCNNSSSKPKTTSAFCSAEIPDRSLAA